MAESAFPAMLINKDTGQALVVISCTVDVGLNPVQ